MFGIVFLRIQIYKDTEARSHFNCWAPEQVFMDADADMYT